MVKNEQAIRAFREILKHMESYSVLADAILEFMLERGEMNNLELNQIIETAKDRQRAKWDQIRAKVDSLLEEEAVEVTAKIA
ncbi:MAG: hypothetical protein WAM04_01805 [Candidatus Sulfotelmatobacter sp.]